MILEKYQMEIGSTIASDPGLHLIGYTTTDGETDRDDEYASMGSQDDDHFIDEIYDGIVYGDIDLYEIMVNATHTIQFQGFYPTHLYKIWRIELYDANRDLYVTTQMSVWSQYPKLRRNYGTNNRILRYKNIQW